MCEISKLKGLGPAAKESLNRIGTYTKNLEKVGSVKALINLYRECNIKPHLNFHSKTFI